MDGTEIHEHEEMDAAVESLDDLKEESGDVDLDQFDKAAEAEDNASQDQAGAQAEAPDQEWDKQRQRADQAEAGRRKIEQEKAALEAQASGHTVRIKELESQIAELTKDQDVNLDDADEAVTDPRVIKKLKLLDAQLKTEQQKRADLEKTMLQEAAKLQAEREEAAKERTQQKVIADIESRLAKRYGVANPVQFRNRAIQMANEICEDRGYSPETTLEAARILEDCYFELADAQTKNKPKSQTRPAVPTDSGKGSSSSPVSAEQKKSCGIREHMRDFRKSLGLS